MPNSPEQAVAAIRQLIREQGLEAALAALPNLAYLVDKPTDSVLESAEYAVAQEVQRRHAATGGYENVLAWLQSRKHPFPQ